MCKKKLYLHGTSRAKKSNITIEEGIRTQEWIPYIARKTTYENIFGLLQKKKKFWAMHYVKQSFLKAKYVEMYCQSI